MVYLGGYKAVQGNFLIVGAVITAINLIYLYM